MKKACTIVWLGRCVDDEGVWLERNGTNLVENNDLNHQLGWCNVLDFYFRTSRTFFYHNPKPINIILYHFSFGLLNILDVGTINVVWLTWVQLFSRVGSFWIFEKFVFKSCPSEGVFFGVSDKCRRVFVVFHYLCCWRAPSPRGLSFPEPVYAGTQSLPVAVTSRGGKWKSWRRIRFSTSMPKGWRKFNSGIRRNS